MKVSSVWNFKYKYRWDGGLLNGLVICVLLIIKIFKRRFEVFVWLIMIGKCY